MIPSFFIKSLPAKTSVFFLNASVFLFSPIALPWLPLHHFFPYIGFTILQSSFAVSMWSASLIGLFYDLVFGSFSGVFSYTHLLVSATAYRYRDHFFDDSPLSFSLFVSLYSLLFSLMLPLISFVISGKQTTLFSEGILGAILSALIDGAFAFLCFSLAPFLLALRSLLFRSLTLKKRTLYD